MEIAEIKIGVPVTYWDIVTENGERFDSLETIITSEPWQLESREVVCRVMGKSGGVSIRHLDPATINE